MSDSINELLRKSEEDSFKLIQEIERIKQEWKQKDEKTKGKRRLQQCKDRIMIESTNNIEEEKEEILEYEQQKNKYRIRIDFSHFSLEQSTEVMKMIDEMGVNDKVGEILISLTEDNSISSAMIERINKKYQNLYQISIGKQSEKIDEGKHKALKDMVEQKTLFKFELRLWDDAGKSENGLKLLKEYNSIFKRNEHLEKLKYHHYRVDESARSRE